MNLLQHTALISKHVHMHARRHARRDKKRPYFRDTPSGERSMYTFHIHILMYQLKDPGVIKMNSAHWDSTWPDDGVKRNLFAAREAPAFWGDTGFKISR